MCCPCFSSKLSNPDPASRSHLPLINQEVAVSPSDQIQHRCNEFFTPLKTYSLTVLTDGQYQIGDFGFNGAKVRKTDAPNKIFTVAKDVLDGKNYEESLTISLLPKYVHLRRYSRAMTPAGFSSPSIITIELGYNRTAFERSGNTLTINLGDTVIGENAPKKYVLKQEDPMFTSMPCIPQEVEETERPLITTRRSI